MSDTTGGGKVSAPADSDREWPKRWWRFVVDPVDLFALLYVGGLFVVVAGPNGGSNLGWAFVRALLWIVALPVAVGYGVWLGKRLGEGK